MSSAVKKIPSALATPFVSLAEGYPLHYLFLCPFSVSLGLPHGPERYTRGRRRRCAGRSWGHTFGRKAQSTKRTMTFWLAQLYKRVFKQQIKRLQNISKPSSIWRARRGERSEKKATMDPRNDVPSQRPPLFALSGTAHGSALRADGRSGSNPQKKRFYWSKRKARNPSEATSDGNLISSCWYNTL